MQRNEAVIDLAAIAQNVATLNSLTSAEVMAVVKADAYGHGLLPSARAALAGGATWLGTAIVAEALQLRAANVTAPVLSWLWAPSESATVQAALAAQIDLSVASLSQLAAVVSAAGVLGLPARIHLKIDTGLSRSGAYGADWSALVSAAARAEAAGSVQVIGIWSHFAYADEPGHPTIARQLDCFTAALDAAARQQVRPQLRHIANSAATLTLPEAHFDLVRPGVGVYGLAPILGRGDFGLTPAMTLQAEVVLTKRVRGGEGVSYGHQYCTEGETTLALVPLGYADGVPRNASNIGPVSINGERFQISGRVCMDQFVVDVGDKQVVAGDTVVLFGTGAAGVPLALDWAQATGTIHYEIITRIGPRVRRTYLGAQR